MKSRLFMKIFAACTATIIIVVALDGFFVAWQTRRDVSLRIKDELTTEGRVLLTIPLLKITGDIRYLAAAAKARLTVVNAMGQVLADSEADIAAMDNHIDRPEIREALLRGEGSAVRFSNTLRMDMMYVAFAVREAGKVNGYVRLAKPVGEVHRTIGLYYRTIFRAFLVILISMILLALFLIPRLMAPLLEITTYTEKLRFNEQAGSLPIRSRDEIGQLAANINLLVQKYDHTIRLAHEEREKLAAALAGTAEGFMILNRENRIELINQGMQKILKNEQNAMVGKTPLEVFRSVELHDNLTRSLKSGTSVEQEFSFGSDDPQRLRVNIAPIQGLPGDDRKTLLVFHDVTALRRLEQVRTDFVANVTHEIKTPLTAIIGFVETLREGALDDPPQAKRFLEIIGTHAARLNRLVDDLLVLSGLERGTETLLPGAVNPAESISQALAVVEARAREKGLELKNSLPAQLPSIRADRDSVIQILVNVLDNAVKFTAAGGVTVSASLQGKDYVAIEIADTGAGIPPEDIPRLGERFYRVDKMRSRELGGTGLGLSIVKHLLKAQRGRMEVESRQEMGTTVRLFFPLSEEPEGTKRYPL